MKCVEAQRLMHPYLENKVPDDKLDEFLTHIRHCSSCREDLEINLAVYSALETEDDDDVDYDFERATEYKLEESERQLDNRTNASAMHRIVVLFAETLLLIILITAVGQHIEQEMLASRFSYENMGGTGNLTEAQFTETETAYTETSSEEIQAVIIQGGTS